MIVETLVHMESRVTCIFLLRGTIRKHHFNLLPIEITGQGIGDFLHVQISLAVHKSFLFEETPNEAL